jgi:TolA-binding protein
MKQLSTRPRFALWQIATFAATIFALQGCGAYFNTFYNTKKFYKEGIEEQKRRGPDNKPTSTEIQKYDKAIEKASKLLQFHPKSRYVDDALLLLGECFFYKQEYLKAQRKFQELITIFPKSGLVPRAQIWLAKTNIELNDYGGAELVLNELQQREKKGELANQAQYFLGEIYFRREQWPEAAKAFEAAARKLGDEKLRGAAYMRLGECHITLHQYDQAAAALRRASAIAKNDVGFKFHARLKYAEALKNDQRLNEALNVLNGMLKEFSTNRDLPFVKLEMADCARLQGKIGTAIKQYVDIIEEHQRTDASAAAFFALGEIHERYYGDYGKAKESYDNVRRESGRSDKVTEAASRSKALGDLIKLKETIATLQRQREALARGQVDSSRLAVAAKKETTASASQRSISHVPRRARNAEAVQEAAKKAGDPNKVAAELAKSKILLAELFMFNFNRPDSAMREYLDVFEFFPQTEYAPQAMYSLAYILGDAPATLAMRDSILQALAVEYANTPQGRGAKRRLGLADTMVVTTAPSLFREAEEVLIAQKDARSAVQLYQKFLQRQPDSKLAAQSLYAMGWIYEHKLADNKQALAAYKKLIETYPDSPMARRVRPKVAAVEQKKNAPAKVEPAQPDQALATAPADSAAQQKSPPARSDSLKAASPLLDDEDVILRRGKNVKQPPRPDSSDVEKEIAKKKNEQNDKEKSEPPDPD